MKKYKKIIKVKNKPNRSNNKPEPKEYSYNYKTIQVRPDIQELAKSLSSKLGCPIYDVIAMAINDLDKKISGESKK